MTIEFFQNGPFGLEDVSSNFLVSFCGGAMSYSSTDSTDSSDFSSSATSSSSDSESDREKGSDEKGKGGTLKAYEEGSSKINQEKINPKINQEKDSIKKTVKQNKKETKVGKKKSQDKEGKKEKKSVKVLRKTIAKNKAVQQNITRKLNLALKQLVSDNKKQLSTINKLKKKGSIKKV